MKARTNEEIKKTINMYENRIKALRKEQITYLLGKHVQARDDLFFWIKAIHRTKDGLVLDGVSFQLDHEVFIYDSVDENNYIIEDIDKLQEIHVEKFYNYIREGIQFVKEEFLSPKSIETTRNTEHELINKYFRIEKNDFFHVQQVQKSSINEVVVTGLNVTLYSKSMFFPKQNMVMTFKVEDLKEISRDVFMKQVKKAIQFIVDSVPDEYKKYIEE